MREDAEGRVSPRILGTFDSFIDCGLILGYEGAQLRKEAPQPSASEVCESGLRGPGARGHGAPRESRVSNQ